MVGQRNLDFEDYVAILRRRLWVILIPAVLGPAIGFGITHWLQEQYMSQTLVLVEQQKVPESYVKSVVTDQLNERLATMQEQILSRTRLQTVMEKVGLNKADAGSAPMEDQVDRLRKAIKVTPVRAMTGTSPGGLPGFYISVTADSARMAQQICAEITSMFMEQNLKDRERRAEGTTDFMANQLEEAKRKLDEQDAKLAAFQSRFGGNLPTDDKGSMNFLMSLNAQLEAANQALSRAQQDKIYLDGQLSQQLSAWQASQTQGGGNPQTLQLQLAQRQNELVALEAHYTSSHPDVIKLKNDIAQLKKEIDEAAAAAKEKPDEKNIKPTAQEPPPIPQLRAQLYQLDQTIREKSREQERLQQAIQKYQSRMEMTPKVEQEYKLLTRDYNTALAFYNSLLSKKNESEMATDLERRQQGEQFRVIDPANYPEKPSYPDRKLFAAGGFGAGASLGLALALLLELRDKALRTDRDVEALLGLPTLAMIPAVPDGNGKKTFFWQRSRGKPRHQEQEGRT